MCCRGRLATVERSVEQECRAPMSWGDLSRSAPAFPYRASMERARGTWNNAIGRDGVPRISGAATRLSARSVLQERMGLELDLGCVRCQAFVWLGSCKPEGWGGFQVGNRYVAEFLAAHTDPCSLVLLDDASDQDWDGGDPWIEDLRSRRYWRLAQGQPVCGSCGGVLGHRGRPRAVGRYLAFCDEACLQASLGLPAEDQLCVSWRRTLAPARLPPAASLWIGSLDRGERRLACHGEVLELIEPEALAWWMIERCALVAWWDAPWAG